MTSSVDIQTLSLYYIYIYIYHPGFAEHQLYKLARAQGSEGDWQRCGLVNCGGMRLPWFLKINAGGKFLVFACKAAGPRPNCIYISCGDMRMSVSSCEEKSVACIFKRVFLFYKPLALRVGYALRASNGMTMFSDGASDWWRCSHG